MPWRVGGVPPLPMHPWGGGGGAHTACSHADSHDLVRRHNPPPPPHTHAPTHLQHVAAVVLRIRELARDLLAQHGAFLWIVVQRLRDGGRGMGRRGGATARGRHRYHGIGGRRGSTRRCCGGTDGAWTWEGGGPSPAPNQWHNSLSRFVLQCSNRIFGSINPGKSRFIAFFWPLRPEHVYKRPACTHPQPVFAVHTPPSSGCPQPASLRFRVREALLHSTRCPGRPPPPPPPRRVGPPPSASPPTNAKRTAKAHLQHVNVVVNLRNLFVLHQQLNGHFVHKRLLVLRLPQPLDHSAECQTRPQHRLQPSLTCTHSKCGGFTTHRLNRQQPLDLLHEISVK